MPIAIVNASSVKLLIEKPRKYMMANVATIDAGIASPGMIVARMFRRNTKMISTTRIAAMSNVSFASSIECVTNFEPSNALSSFTPVGSVCWIAGSSSRIRFATSIRFALDCRTTPMATEGVPFQRKIERSSSGPSSTRETSFSLTCWLPWLATTISPNSCGVFSSPRERTENSRRVDSIRPAGISTLRETIAFCTSCTVSPRAESAWGSTHTRIEKRRSPKMAALPTPGRLCNRALTSRSATSDSCIKS